MENFKETKTGDLIKRIENLKAERERMADCLARLESELEHRKRKVPLGVPDIGEFFIDGRGYAAETSYEDDIEAVNFNSFSSFDSACKHSEMLRDWRKDGLMVNAKGEPIDIKVLLPLMRKGYVAMDEDGSWFWYECKPFREIGGFWNSTKGKFTSLEEVSSVFNIKPAEDWRNSLMECGL